jgi:hypothetical protein
VSTRVTKHEDKDGKEITGIHHVNLNRVTVARSQTTVEWTHGLHDRTPFWEATLALALQEVPF